LNEDTAKIGSIDECVLTRGGTNPLVNFVDESTKNHVHKVKGHISSFFYSPYFMGLPTNLYFQSGILAYNKMRAESVVNMPSYDTLTKNK
jgi:hypothetical protein